MDCVNTSKYGLNSVRVFSSEVWQKVPIEIKNKNSLTVDNQPLTYKALCNLWKKYAQALPYTNFYVYNDHTTVFKQIVVNVLWKLKGVENGTWNIWNYYLANIYLLKVNNRNTRKRCKNSSKSTIKTAFSSISIVDFEQVNVSWVNASNTSS